MIGVPSYDGKVDAHLTDALLHEFPRLAMLGWQTGFQASLGIAIVSTARNKLCERFLADRWKDPWGREHAFTDLVFIDADVSFPAGALARLLEHDVDVVFGATPLKVEGEGYPCELARDEQGAAAANGETGLFEATYGPAGFLRIRRGALERLAAWQAEHGVEEVVERNAFGEELGRYRAFFHIAHEGTRYVGEDVWFFERWREAGGQAWLDPGIELFHTGTKRWRGHVGEFLRARQAELDDERAVQKRLEAGRAEKGIQAGSAA